MYHIAKFTLVGVLGSLTYQSYVDLHIKFLNRDIESMKYQMTSHEKFKMQALTQLASHPTDISIRESFEKDCDKSAIFYHNKDLSIKEAKETLQELEEQVEMLVNRSIFPYLRQPEKLIFVAYKLKDHANMIKAMIFKNE